MAIHKVIKQDGSEPIGMGDWIWTLPEPQRSEYLRISKEHLELMSQDSGSPEWPVVWETYITANDLVHLIEEE